MRHGSIHWKKGTSGGFTLLEVLVAMTVLALAMAAITTAFRTGVKTYEIGITHTESQEMGRYAVKQLQQDLRNVYYRPEQTYNVTRRQREAQQMEQERAMLQSGARSNPVEEVLPDLGPPIDLSFIGTDGSEQDDLTFVVATGNKEGAQPMPWGLGRVHYFLSDGALYRSMDDITVPETDENGNELAKPNPPRVDKVANFCTHFDLKYGYYFEGEWKAAESWDSNSTQFRNPQDEEEEEEMNPAQGQPGGIAVQTQQRQRRPDDLPGWVDLTLKFADPKGKEKEKVYHQVILMPQKFANETYVPPDKENENPNAGRSRSGRSGGSRSGTRSGGRSSGRSGGSARGAGAQ